MTGRLPRPRRRRRGFTILEVVVASVLAVGFALVVSAALVSTSNAAGESVGKATLERSARQVADTATRYLRGAAPPGMCLNPLREDGWPLSACSRVGERAAAFTAASPTSATFYSYATAPGSVSGGDVLTAPDLVRMDVQDGVLRIVRYAAAPGATYTSPSQVADAEVLRQVTVRGASAAFRFYDARGQQLGADRDLTAGELRRIALVEFDPVLIARIGGEERSAGIEVTVAVGTSGRSS